MGAARLSPRPEQGAQPSPLLFFQTMNAFQRSAALHGAIDLDLFTAIGEGNTTVAKLARRIDASERGTRILCDFLTICGFLSKSDGSYALTLDSAVFLDRRSPAYLGTATRFLHSEAGMNNFRDVAATVRRGGSLPDSPSMAPESPFWVEFARGMAPLVRPAAEWIADFIAALPASPLRVLDIAAGHGMYGVLIAARREDARITAVDWPNVLEVAAENARAFSVADRHSLNPGSAFEVDLGAGYDVALVTNFLHHFDAATNEKLLRRVHDALKPGGCALALEFVPNDDRVSPPVPASFSFSMLAATPSGDAHTFREIRSMFAAAGFHSIELHEVPATMQHVVTGRK